MSNNICLFVTLCECGYIACNPNIYSIGYVEKLEKPFSV